MRVLRRVGLCALLAGAVGLLAACSGSGPLLRTEHGPIAELDVSQAQAGALVSAYRQDHRLGTVTLDPVLQRVAQAQADAMASANELSHTVAGPLPSRLAPFGRGRGASVENVSAGYPDFAAALGGWRRSPHHNENLLYPPMRRIGVAGAAAPGTRYKTFWALVMTD